MVARLIVDDDITNTIIVSLELYQNSVLVHYITS